MALKMVMLLFLVSKISFHWVFIIFLIIHTIQMKWYFRQRHSVRNLSATNQFCSLFQAVAAAGRETNYSLYKRGLTVLVKVIMGGYKGNDVRTLAKSRWWSRKFSSNQLNCSPHSEICVLMNENLGCKRGSVNWWNKDLCLGYVLKATEIYPFELFSH